MPPGCYNRNGQRTKRTAQKTAGTFKTQSERAAEAAEKADSLALERKLFVDENEEKKTQSNNPIAGLKIMQSNNPMNVSRNMWNNNPMAGSPTFPNEERNPSNTARNAHDDRAFNVSLFTATANTAATAPLATVAKTNPPPYHCY
jgi:hypothetical protein